ncbi:MAG: hypothetical protein ACYCXD_01975 [Coriobacteriia bacterium]
MKSHVETHVRLGSVWLVVCLLVLVALVAVGGCSARYADVDRGDPTEVLRSYFDAWERNDSSAKESFMAATYAGTVPEPVKSIEIVDISQVERSSTRCLFEVSFDIVTKGEGVSMTTGRYDWIYELTWDADRQSWIITHYGFG